MSQVIKTLGGGYGQQSGAPASTDKFLLDKGAGNYVWSTASDVLGAAGGGTNIYKTVGKAGSGADFLTSNYANDAQAHQAAVNAVIALGGGTVFVLSDPTAYNITEPTYILGSNVVIEGGGWDSTHYFLTNGANCEIFVCGNAALACNRVSFRNFGMDGNKANQTLGGNARPGGTNVLLRYRSDAQNSYGGEVSGIYAKAGIQIGISSESQSGLDIHNNFTDDNAQFGIWFENGDSTIITNNYSNLDNTAIKVYSAGRSIVSGNISKSARNGAFGLQSTQEIAFSNNHAYRAGWFSPFSTTNSHSFNFSAVQNSVFSNCNSYAPYGHGIVLNGCDNNVLSNFAFRRTGQGVTNNYSDVYLTDEGGGTVCNNNYFSNFTFNNESPAYYSERVRSNIRMNRTDAHTGNIFTNFKFDRRNPPLTAYVENLQSTTAQGSGLDVELNTVTNSLGINPDLMFYHGNKTGAVTVDRVLGRTQTMTATGNITLTLAAGLIVGDVLELRVIQDGTGARTISKPANSKLVGGAFSPSAGANAIDMWRLEWDGTNWNEIGRSLNVS